MGSKRSFTRIVMQAIIIILPISVLIYEFTASKLNTYRQSGLATLALLFLLFYSSLFCYQNRRYLHFRETKYVLLFTLFSLPAYFMSSFVSMESYVRYFTLISFVPLGFMSGLSWGYHYNTVEDRRKDRLLTVFMIPSIIAAGMIANSSSFVLFNDDAIRDYVFGLVLFLPLVLVYRKVLLPIIFIIIASYICIISAKRTGMLCVASVTVFFVLIKLGVKKAKVSSIVTTALVALFVLFFAYKYLPDITPQWENTVERLNSMDDESNEIRLIKYERVWEELQSSNLITLLFGHGCYASVDYYGTPIHNDWLEIVLDYGIFSLLCIFALFFSLLIRALKSLKKDFQSSLILLATLVVFFITTGGNCMFTNPVAVFVLLFTLGFALSNMIILGSNDLIFARLDK